MRHLPQPFTITDYVETAEYCSLQRDVLYNSTQNMYLWKNTKTTEDVSRVLTM